MGFFETFYFNHCAMKYLFADVTILLSLTVFLNTVSESMPNTSDAVPLISMQKSKFKVAVFTKPVVDQILSNPLLFFSYYMTQWTLFPFNLFHLIILTYPAQHLGTSTPIDYTLFFNCLDCL